MKKRKILHYTPERLPDKRRMLYYCDFGHHQGLIPYDLARECLERKCKHYREFDVRNMNQMWGNNHAK